MANVKISDLSNGAALDGSELIEMVQGGVSLKTTTQEIADLAAGVSSVKIHVSSAEILALNATPKILVAGTSGKIIMPLKVVFKYNYGTTPYSSQTVSIGFTNGISGGYQNALTYLNSGSSFSYLSTAPTEGLWATLNNYSLALSATGAFTGGDGTLDVYVVYQLIDA